MLRRKLATVTPGMALGYWKARNRPARARLSGESLTMLSPCQVMFPASTLVLGVAKQGVGQARLARAVRAHQGVDLALGNGQRQPLEDLALPGADFEVGDHQLVGHEAPFMVWDWAWAVASAAARMRRRTSGE